MRARRGVTLQRAGAEAILHDREAGQAHVINATAAQLWELADGLTQDELVAAFASACEQPADRVRSDVERVVGQFRGLGLLASDDRPS